MLRGNGGGVDGQKVGVGDSLMNQSNNVAEGMTR